MSRHTRASLKDPSLTVAFGWDPPLGTFWCWVAPDCGDCDAQQIVLDAGSRPGQIAEPEALNEAARDHAVFDAEDCARLRRDRLAEGGPAHAPAIARLLKSMSERTQ